MAIHTINPKGPEHPLAATGKRKARKVYYEWWPDLGRWVVVMEYPAFGRKVRKSEHDNAYEASLAVDGVRQEHDTYRVRIGWEQNRRRMLNG